MPPPKPPSSQVGEPDVCEPRAQLAALVRQPPAEAEKESWRWLHQAVGLEVFGRPAGPWGALAAPFPAIALLLYGALAWLWPKDLGLNLYNHLNEFLWLTFAPFWLATVAHAVAQTVAELTWRATEGERLFDFSPRRWHYALAFAFCALPLLVIQFSDTALDHSLRLWLAIRHLVGPPYGGHLGYTPGTSHLLPLLALPLVLYQAHALIKAIPAGRLLGLQRDLAKLRGAVGWGPDAWREAVEDALDHWLSDIRTEAFDPAATGLSTFARNQRQRWTGLRKELCAAWVSEPPDLVRANRAIRVYRQSLSRPE